MVKNQIRAAVPGAGRDLKPSSSRLPLVRHARPARRTPTGTPIALSRTFGVEQPRVCRKGGSVMCAGDRPTNGTHFKARTDSRSATPPVSTDAQDLTAQRWYDNEVGEDIQLAQDFKTFVQALQSEDAFGAD
jgi:hypothetical protein